MAFSYSTGFKNKILNSAERHLTLTGVTGTFQVGEEVSCSGGNKGVGKVVAISGSILYLYPAAGTFGGTITGGTSAATGTYSAITDANGGSLADIFNGGVIDIYSGTRPTSADNTASGTLLGTITKNGGTFIAGTLTNGLRFDVAADGSIDKPSTDVWQFTGVAAGVATWFRLRGNAADSGASSTTLPRIDGSIAAFGGDATLSDTNITVGKVYTSSKCKFTWP
jgi:hypothetical protein